jgi:hypothetical protein
MTAYVFDSVTPVAHTASQEQAEKAEIAKLDAQYHVAATHHHHSEIAGHIASAWHFMTNTIPFGLVYILVAIVALVFFTLSAIVVNSIINDNPSQDGATALIARSINYGVLALVAQVYTGAFSWMLFLFVRLFQANPRQFPWPYAKLPIGYTVGCVLFSVGITLVFMWYIHRPFHIGTSIFSVVMVFIVMGILFYVPLNRSGDSALLENSGYYYQVYGPSVFYDFTGPPSQSQ